jgi:hypothetical protein
MVDTNAKTIKAKYDFAKKACVSKASRQGLVTRRQ